MADTITKKLANRYGLNLNFYTFADDGAVASNATPVATIDFANEVSLEISGDTVFATGGQNHSNKVGFNEPLTGTLTVSTQLVTFALLKLITGGEGGDDKASFKNASTTVAPKYYIVEGETVWQAEDGTTYTQKIKCYKACVKPGYNVTYNGSGDPQSIDVVFNLLTNSGGNLVDIEGEAISAGG